jgi:hypothetical protein
VKNSPDKDSSLKSTLSRFVTGRRLLLALNVPRTDEKRAVPLLFLKIGVGAESVTFQFYPAFFERSKYEDFRYNRYRLATKSYQI